MDDLQAQIEQLRANRGRQRQRRALDEHVIGERIAERRTQEERTFAQDPFFEDNEITEKKEEGVMGVLLFQCIVAILLAIVYVLLMTFANPACRDITSLLKDKSVNDFSFQDKVYETVGAMLTYLNELEPVDITPESDAVDQGVASTLPTDAPIESLPAESEAPASSLPTESDALADGAGGSVNPVVDHQMPENATFAPVIFTGRITFPLGVDYRITSSYGFRDHPSQKIAEFHTAYDLAVPKGTPILAVADGNVVKSEKASDLGNYILLDHGNDFFTLYAHCDRLIAKEGARIREGEIIARAGSTGDSTGNHLHFAMKKDGLYFDPSYVYKELADAAV